MNKVLALLITILLAGQISAQEVKLDRYVIDDFEKLQGWNTVAGGKVSSNDLLVKQGRKSLKWTASIIKVRNSVTGIEKTGLAIPVPEKITFQLYAEVPFIFVGLSDSQGNHVAQIPISGLQPKQWNLIELSPKTMSTVGRGAKPLADLDGVYIGTEDGAGEFPSTGKYDFYIDDLAAFYPAGTSPGQELYPPRAQLDANLATVKQRLAKIDELMAKAESEKIDVSYPRVSRTVIAQFVDYAEAEAGEGKLPRAHRQADFLLQCADRTINELNDILADRTKAISAASVPMLDLVARDGAFYSGNRPVQMVGLCGWWDESYFPTVAGTGFNCISMEIGPSGTLVSTAEINDKSIAGVLSIMDDAKSHNMAVDLLISPHYFPDWAYAQFPAVDANKARRSRGSFMPWDVGNADFRAVIEKHIGALIPKVSAHPSLVSYDLVNEAWYDMMGDFDQTEYQKWAASQPQGKDFWASVSEFNKARVVEFFRWYADTVHKFDTKRPTWTKVIGGGEVLGIDREAIGDVLDANGMDCFPRYPDPTGRYALDIWTQAIMHDTYRSFQPGKPILDGEYHIIPYGRIVPPGYVRTCLWNAHLHGRDFSAIWVWGRDLENDQHCFYTQPWAVEEAGRTALDLQRLAEYVVELSRQKAEVALFYGGGDFQRTYETLYFLDAPFDLISERRIMSGKLKDYKLLVIPDGAEISKDADKIVEAFRKSGGIVDHCTVRSSDVMLRVELAGKYADARIQRPVRAGEWGVELRSAMVNGTRAAYAINYTKKPVKLNLKAEGDFKEARDLISGKEMGLKFTLEPMSPVLLELH